MMCLLCLLYIMAKNGKKQRKYSENHLNDRHLLQHIEVKKEDYKKMTAYSLYNADTVIPRNKEKILLQF